MFCRPVDEKYPVLHDFAEWGERWQWLVDKDTGLWIPRGSNPELKGQHRGVDFDCPIGTVISAMANGMIVKTRYESSTDTKAGAGLHIIQIVECFGYDSWWIRYSHLRAIYVNVGQRVKAGQPIGESGDSGAVDKPLLHVDLADTKMPPQYHPIPWKT